MTISVGKAQPSVTRIAARLAFATALALLLFSFESWAEVYRSGISFNGFQALDQHDRPFTFKPGDANFIIFDTPGLSGPSAAPQDSAWFDKHHALLIVNISDLSYFKRKVARSRLQSKPFRSLVLADKDTASRFPRQDGKLTVLLVNAEGTITDIRYAAGGKELQTLLSDK